MQLFILPYCQFWHILYKKVLPSFKDKGRKGQREFAFIMVILGYTLGSGHACGVAGPIVMSIYLLGGYTWFFILLIPIVFWSRLKMGRHTIQELILGLLVPILSTFLSVAIIH